jgi:hypothetical protein
MRPQLIIHRGGVPIAYFEDPRRHDDDPIYLRLFVGDHEQWIIWPKDDNGHPVPIGITEEDGFADVVPAVPSVGVRRTR